MKNIKISIGDILIFKQEDSIVLGKTNVCEGKVLNILKVIKSEKNQVKNNLVFEVKNPYFEDYFNQNSYIKESQIIGKKRTIIVNKDIVNFKHPQNNTILSGIISSIIKTYNNDNTLDKINYIIKSEDNSIYTIDSSHFITEDYEILEIK